MTKPNRNAPCPCGSGKKFKRCHGLTPSVRRVNPETLPPKLRKELLLKLKQSNAEEHQRQLLQGKGKPIISIESNGYRIVAVGKTLHWAKTWKTFPDFLSEYLKRRMTSDWGNRELAAPPETRHPLLNWYQKVCAIQAASAREPGRVFTTAMTGASKGYLGLAYDLYLSEHNAELPEILLKRLRNKNTFEGALYEAFVLGCFARAGFSIELENENDSNTTHCEFTATHKGTGRKFSVEAKAVSAGSRRAGHSTEPPRIRGKLADALQKRAKHERIVFIELSRAPSDPGKQPMWIDQVQDELRAAETSFAFDGQPVPPAYVFVTNRPFLYALDDQNCEEMIFATGFKNDFPFGRGPQTILQAHRIRQAHTEVHWLFDALKAHNAIPSTFDQRTAEEAFADAPVSRLRIGQRYTFRDDAGVAVSGEVEEAIVVEEKQEILAFIRTSDEHRLSLKLPMTDDEFRIYKRCPDTFFGIFKETTKEITEPLELFDFFYETYSRSTHEKLLSFLKDWPDFEQLKQLTQKELAEQYCERMTLAAMSRSRPKAQTTSKD